MDNSFFGLQIATVLLLFGAGLVWPAEQRQQSAGYWPMWMGMQLFSLAWFAAVVWVWPSLPRTQLTSHWSMAAQMLIMYGVYSGVAYVWHLARHRVRVLWVYLHSQHHHPTHLDTLVALYRHPAELVSDSVIVLTTACLLGVEWPALVAALGIELLLESWHHSNLRWRPQSKIGRYWVRALQTVLQTPDMHRIHHQRGAHYGNYGTLSLWDSLFGTLVRPVNKSYSVGMKGSALYFLTWSNKHKESSRGDNLKKTPRGHGRDTHSPARRLAASNQSTANLADQPRDKDQSSVVDEIS
jgi:sterol desaturase/sphingolipid hydroxylase (fatty acid hydroxylase superfamily)